tara:strand:+ start:1393 stop:1908 length:516 start_codon:yes stop_codon:yes gene_type:complete
MPKLIKNIITLTTIKEHKRAKPKLMSQIKDMPNQGVANITKTDWDLPKDFKRPYLETFYELISPYMDLFTEKNHCKNWVIHNTWFHEYHKKSDFTWHVHPHCQFANVYFLNLPDKKTTTEILDTNSKLIKVDVEEGDILTFPSYLRHRSPMIKNLHKTVIAFNSSIQDAIY